MGVNAMHIMLLELRKELSRSNFSHPDRSEVSLCESTENRRGSIPRGMVSSLALQESIDIQRVMSIPSGHSLVSNDAYEVPQHVKVLEGRR